MTNSAASAAREPQRNPTVLVVGNPNTGKSTLFNALTGMSARVGNFTGTTVSRKVGKWQLRDVEVTLVDLPGTYSLAARSPEERVAIDMVLGVRGNDAPDALVVVGDTPRLLRSLYLLLQLLELEVPIVLGLNLMDEARAQGCVPDVVALSAELGIPVVPLVARSGEGVDALADAVAQTLGTPMIPGGCHSWPTDLLADAEEVVAAFPALWGDIVIGRPGRARAVALWMLLSVDAEQESLDDLPLETIHRIQQRAIDAGRDLA